MAPRGTGDSTRTREDSEKKNGRVCSSAIEAAKRRSEATVVVARMKRRKKGVGVKYGPDFSLALITGSDLCCQGTISCPEGSRDGNE